MEFYYEKIICPRCHSNLDDINQYHKDPKQKTCAGKFIKGAYVYLILDVTNDVLKIGYSVNPKQRLKQLKQATTNKLQMIGWIPGSITNEKIIQTIFQKSKFDREWFINDTDIIEYFINHSLFRSG